MQKNFGVTIPFGAALGILVTLIFFDVSMLVWGIIGGAALGLLYGLAANWPPS